MFDLLSAMPEDPILGLMAAYRKDPREQKIDLGVGVVSSVLPRLNLGAHLLQVVEAPIQTLAGQHTEFDFGHIEPTAFLRRIVHLKLLSKLKCVVRRQDLIKRTGCMGIQVVLDQTNTINSRIV